MKFVYPVDPKNGNDKYPFYLKGASNLTGYYPIGRMNTWHGGIHYEGDNPIKAMADGKIIAYRVPKEYHTETIDNKTSEYSNGFVLIEHNYKSPNGLELNFYSLYNHLASYLEMGKGKFPGFLTIDSYTVANEANDTIQIKGVTIKSSSSGGTTLAVAAKGTVLSFLEEPNNNDRRKVKYITPNGKEIIGYTWIKKYNNVQLVDKETGEVLAEPFSGSNGDYGAELREKADPKSDLKKLLARGIAIEIYEKYKGKTGWLKVKKAGGESVNGYCHSDGLSIVDVVALKEEDTDKVINDQCYQVKAGDIIGYAGLNGFEKKEEYRGCHVEVFTHEEVNDFLNNAKDDGEKNKNFTKITEGTELKRKLPLKVIKNLPIKKTGKTTDGYTEVEVDNLEVVVNNRSIDLPQDYSSTTKLYAFCNEGSNVTANQNALTEFNAIVGDIAQMGDAVKLIKNYNTSNQTSNNRKVEFQTPNKGQTFWVKNEELEEKTLTFTITTTTTNANSQTTNLTAEVNAGSQNSAEVVGFGVDAPLALVVAAPATAVVTTTIETKKYFRLNKELSEVYIISPEEDNVNTQIESDVIVNIKEGKQFTDKDDKKWYLIEPTGLQKNGVAIKYKGLISKDDLGETFSAYNWSKFGFVVKEDDDNNYIYDFKNKNAFFTEICNVVDEDNNGILEPHELQSALNNHYTANKLSHFVCKHHNEWAYGGKYLTPLMDEVTAVLDKGIEQEEDEVLKKDLETLKEERLDAFEAKVNQLALWEGIEARKSSYLTKWVNGDLVTTSIITGGYLSYKFGKWMYEKITNSDEPEREIPLSPFPIEKPVVYHFHPVAFVEQMKKCFSCYCNRDMLVDEVRAIVLALRETEPDVYQGENKDKLFWKSNCNIPKIDKNFERFTEELNLAFKKYEINTCLRKIHFLSQIYLETDRLRTTREYGENLSYDPWRGRGLMQLTWESNYKMYKVFSGVDCVTDFEKIANNLKNAVDSAGWYWKQGKKLGSGTTWTAPSSAPSYVTSKNPSYQKDRIEYQEDGVVKSYYTIDFGLIADDDYTDVISWLVNGGSNGLSERRDYVNKLKIIFDYEKSCQNKR